jgi:hypothetical protein
VAKADLWALPDAEARKLGERTGLDTPVVLALNDECLVSGVIKSPGAVANALSIPPGEYGRKTETQRN